MLSPELFKEFWLEPSGRFARSSGRDEPIYNYYNARFAGAEWHGGVTWYQKHGGIDGAIRCVEIGCDFSHAWDQPSAFDFSIVEFEAKNTIDKLLEIYPFYSRCSYTGKTGPSEDFVKVGSRLFHKSADKAIEEAKARGEV